MATYSQIAMQVGTKKVASVHRMSPIIDNVTKKGKSEYGIKLCSNIYRFLLFIYLS